MTSSGRRIAATTDLIVLARVVGKVAVAQPVGHLHPGNADVLLGALLKAAADEARSLIVDLEHVWFEADGFVAVFVPLEREGAAWPGVPVVLVGSEDDRPELTELCGKLTSSSLAPDPVTAFRAALSRCGHNNPSSEARITASRRLETPSLR